MDRVRGTVTKISGGTSSVDAGDAGVFACDLRARLFRKEGVRLAVGTAWLVIVAAEMLTGGVGIGFWVWDEWNNLNVKNIVIAIFTIGIVGLILEHALIKLATAFTYDDVKL